MNSVFFMIESNSNLTTWVDNEDCVRKLVYIKDFFFTLTELNLQLQSFLENTFKSDKVYMF